MHHQVTEWATQRVDLRFGAERGAQAGEDLISWMMQDSDTSDDPLTDEQLATPVSDMLSAGQETSGHFLTMLMSRVLRDHPLWQALPGNAEPIAATLKEALPPMGRPKRSGGLRSVTSSWPESSSRSAPWYLSSSAKPASTRRHWLRRRSLCYAGQRIAAPGLWARHPYLRRGGQRPGRDAHQPRHARVSATDLRLANRLGQLFRPSAVQRSAGRLYVAWD
jgi:hypothetical protein